MQANPLFPVAEKFPELDRDASADIIIVGAGIAGISSAYFLAESGYKVVVVEEEEIGSKATGASSGILYYGTGTTLTEAVRLWGMETAAAIWNETRISIDGIENIIRKHNIDCCLEKSGSIVVAKTDEERDFLEGELKALKQLGLAGNLLEKKDIKKHFTQKEFVAGLEQKETMQISPALFAAGLAKSAGIDVFVNSPMTGFEKAGGKIVVKTPKAKITAQKLILATNLQPFFGLEKHFFMENSVILATKRMEEQKLKKLFPEPRILWTLEEKYDIIYPRDSRAVFEAYSMKGAKEKLNYYFPAFNFSSQQEHAWGDGWAKTADWMPIIGKVRESVFVSVAMGDQGIVAGFTAGRKAPDMAEGTSDKFLSMARPGRFQTH